MIHYASNSVRFSIRHSLVYFVREFSQRWTSSASIIQSTKLFSAFSTSSAFWNSKFRTFASYASKRNGHSFDERQRKNDRESAISLDETSRTQTAVFSVSNGS